MRRHHGHGHGRLRIIEGFHPTLEQGLRDGSVDFCIGVDIFRRIGISVKGGARKVRPAQARGMKEMMVIKPAFHHVTIKTSRLQAMVDWYKAVVGVEVTFQDAHNAWTSNDEANHRVAFLSVPGLEEDADKVKHTGMHHSAFEYASFDDLMASYERMRGLGIVPAFCLDHGLTISLYYQDPEGNYVELQSDNFGDWKQSSHFMRTSPDFQSNPIGTFFDPQKVWEAHKAGEAFATLQPAIRAGKFKPATIPPMGLPTAEAGQPVPLGS